MIGGTGRKHDDDDYDGNIRVETGSLLIIRFWAWAKCVQA